MEDLTGLTLAFDAVVNLDLGNDDDGVIFAALFDEEEALFDEEETGLRTAGLFLLEGEEAGFLLLGDAMVFPLSSPLLLGDAMVSPLSSPLLMDDGSRECEKKVVVSMLRMNYHGKKKRNRCTTHHHRKRKKN